MCEQCYREGKSFPGPVSQLAKGSKRTAAADGDAMVREAVRAGGSEERAGEEHDERRKESGRPAGREGREAIEGHVVAHRKSSRHAKRPQDTKALDCPASGWLLAFANLGLDDGKPRPPGMEMLGSRFLGLDGRTRGYVKDPKRPYDNIIPSPFGEGEVQTQEYRGVTKRWLLHPQLGGGKQLVPWVQVEAPITSSAVEAFYAEWPRGFESGKMVWRQRELGDNALGVGEVLERMEDIRDIVRYRLLEPIWYLGRLDDKDDLRGLVLAAARAVVQYILEYCVWGEEEAFLLADRVPPGRDPRAAAAPAPPFAEPMREMIRWIESVIWHNRAPVYLRATTGRWSWDAVGFPGLVWAEALTACFSWPDLDHGLTDLRWSSLRCCRWCGRFFVLDAGHQGRPKDFCTVRCGKTYHDYGPGDRL